MITIFCGENISESRKQYSLHRDALRSKGFEFQGISSTDSIDEISQLLHSTSLFETEVAFTGENVSSKKEIRTVLNSLQNSVDIILWEEKYTDKELAKYYKTATIKASKLPSSLWSLLDELRPSNLKKVYTILESIKDTVDEYMLLFMVQRRAKELIIIAEPTAAAKMAPWQAGKLRKQASFWDNSKLLAFYKKLIDIERTIKTDASPYTSRQLLDILCCFYLK